MSEKVSQTMEPQPNYQDLTDKKSTYYASDRADILPFVPPAISKTLEFGCGYGNFSAMIKDRFKTETWAVELHPAAAEAASKKLDRVFCMDAFEALKELPDNTFDCIFFLDVLEHLVDPYTLLDKCRDKLSDTGVVIASIPNIRYYRAFKDYVLYGKWEYEQQGIMDIGHVRFFTYSSIKKMFENLNYRLVQLQGVHTTGSRTFRILNTLLLNAIWDVRYRHFIAVAGKA